MTGNAYFGHTFGRKSSKFHRFGLILWNAVLLSVMVWHCCNQIRYIVFSQSLLENGANSTDGSVSVKENKPKNQKAVLLEILNDVRGICESSESLIIGLYLAVRGHQLIAIIEELNRLVNISTQTEFRIGLIVIVLHFSYSLMVNAVNTTLFMCMSPRSATDVFIGVLYFILLNTRLTVLSLILYLGCVVRKRINAMVERVSPEMDLKSAYVFANELNDKVKRMDEVLSFYNLVIVSLNSTMSMSYVCVLAIDPVHNRVAISALIESLVTLMSLCLASDIIPKSFRQLVHQLSKTFTRTQNSRFDLINNRLILSHMKDMQNEMSFTIYDTFRVNTNTFLSCLTLILTYSVILIQTN